MKPDKCSNCQGIGHDTQDCRVQKIRKMWVPKTKVFKITTEARVIEKAKEVEVDQEGFQKALKPIMVRMAATEPTTITNPFQALHMEARKQNEVKSYINSHAVGLVSLLETKVKARILGMVYQRVFPGWCFTSNSSMHDGGRILLAWKATSFNVTIVKITSQLIHCLVQPIGKTTGFYCSLVYAYNDRKGREELWKDLRSVSTSDPWLLSGDLNCVMNTDERIGATVREVEMVDIRECMNVCGLEDIKSTRHFYTWNNKQEGKQRVFSKLDRVMANIGWQEAFPSPEVCFQEEGDFDHSPALITVYPREDTGRKPFRYFTMWKDSSQYRSVVQQAWNSSIQGSKMFRVMKKLKLVKIALKELNKELGNGDSPKLDASVS
ncbi:uncharacterized protein LOC104901151 [Beta vulgaris subsp. vulgaris]|uniref:uncharacterized protein LOC104901151 n=1 Tax=Beta vulgaris subsp. vulgaris TaxID=3555 RepID=UPI00203731D3|nr:uncharacterized protein LOC104901151 [Beta vulgaris subsp. vulgaris]